MIAIDYRGRGQSDYDRNPDNYNFLNEMADVLGELKVGYGKLSTSFRTRNRNRPGEAIDVRLDSGPFHTLEGSWTFEPAEEGCRVNLELRFELAGELVNKALDPLFTHEAETLVDAFQKRATKLHGDQPTSG